MCLLVFVCVYVSVYVCVCVYVLAQVCVHTICSQCESYNINSLFFYSIKYKTYFEAILISLDEAKFDNASEQFKFGAHIVHNIQAVV